MRVWTKSACVVLAWSIVIILVAVGMKVSVRPAQANIRIANSSTRVTLASTASAAAPGTAARPAARYVVQPGDTLSGIAARFAVRGGWPVLYAANRPHIGPNPNLIHPGAVLVLPGQMAMVRYTVAPGDTLAGIAAALAVPGGWAALYAANRDVIGPDPNLIRAGTVLTVRRPTAPSPAAASPAPRRYPAPPSAPAGTGHRPRPGRTGPPAAAGMPTWLTALLAAGLLTGAALLASLVLLARRQRRQAAGEAVLLGNVGVSRPRSSGVAAAVRPVAATARVHPAAVAVPCAVLVTGIVLVTFVTSATTRAAPPPGKPGPGPVPAARPSTGQPSHRHRPRPPIPPAVPGSPGQNDWGLTGSLQQAARSLPAPAAVPPAGSRRAPQPSRNPSSPLAGGGLVRDARRVPSYAATAAAGLGGADR